MLKVLIFLIIYLLSIIIVRIHIKLDNHRKNKNIILDSNITDVFFTLFPLINTIGAILIIMRVINKNIFLNN